MRRPLHTAWGFALTELATDRLIADWKAAHPGRTLTWPGYGRAPGEIMRVFLSDLAARCGSVRGYAAELLGVDSELTTALRMHLLAA